MADTSKQLAAVLRKQWQRYQDLYTPAEDELIASLGESNAAEAADQAVENTQRGHAATTRMRERYGMAEIDPEISARNRDVETSLSNTSAFNRTRLAEVDRNDMVRSQLVGVGQGLLNQATGGLTDAAGMQTDRNTAYQNAMSNYKATNASLSAQHSAQRTQAVGTVATMAMMAAFMM